MKDNNTSYPERRKHPRFSASQDVIVTTMPGYKNIGQMIDISLGGLSFYYIDQDFQSEESFDICLVIPGTNYYLEGVHAKTVSDIEISSSSSAGCIVMRRRGIMFDQLTDEQISELGHFIEYNTYAAHTIPHK